MPAPEGIQVSLVERVLFVPGVMMLFLKCKALLKVLGGLGSVTEETTKVSVYSSNAGVLPVFCIKKPI